MMKYIRSTLKSWVENRLIAFWAVALVPVAFAAAWRFEVLDGLPNAGATAITTATPVEMDGVGPVRIGMPLADAERLLGEGLAVSGSAAGSTCAYATPRSGPSGLSFMLADGVVVRVDVMQAGMRTKQGVAVGSSEAQVLEAFGKFAKVTPHKYDAEGHYVVVTSPDDRQRDLRYVFETSRGVVTKFRAGRLPAVGYVEDCL